MHKKLLIPISAMCIALLTSCGNKSENAVKPMLDLDWFASYDDVKENMGDYTLLNERENTEQKVPQKMQDYENVELFDYDCDLTLCFTDSGLIGFNYHDVQHNQNYREWYSTLESTYGLPTEESSGMASWYDNPAGKDTAIYLFNLEEGVQMSIYATADSPSKSYEKERTVPTPEIRTPIVPVDVTTQRSTDKSNDSITTDENGNAVTTTRVYREGDVDVIGTDPVGNYIVAVTDAVGDAVTDKAGETVTTIIPAETAVTDKDGKPVTTGSVKSTSKGGTTETTTTAAADSKNENYSTEKATEPPVDRTKSFLLNGLQFYGSPDSERRKMSSYTQLYEYRTEEPGQPWELIMEYENVPYEGKNCDGVLCFTSLGLVGINYFDSNTSDYSYWVKTLTDIYGSPDETQYDYTAWSSSPVGSGTMIYVFALEDGVQISFFADDAGAELA
ncbi:MAG: hypothetical protein BWZ04_01347 [Firmicutes bacterium ADurb.BinA205]|nr:MAG: hypothetical protein BWZ04_01347 [Firmicutes bacterium ADurb.BinA205]